jgi:uncharacterized protein (DUF433 family)
MVEMSRKQQLIEHTAGASGVAMPRIKGSRIRVSDIAFHYMQMESETPAERIQRVYPNLSIEQIEAAIEYWQSHPQEIAEEMAAERDALNDLKTQLPLHHQ